MTIKETAKNLLEEVCELLEALSSSASDDFKRNVARARWGSYVGTLAGQLGIPWRGWDSVMKDVYEDDDPISVMKGHLISLRRDLERLLGGRSE